MKSLLVFLKHEHLYHTSVFAYFPHHAFCTHITCAVVLITALILLPNEITVILLKAQEDFLIVEL